MTKPERGSFPQEERGEGTVPKDSQVKETKKQDKDQMRQPCSGDRVKPTAPFEDRQSQVIKLPTALLDLIQQMPANGDDPQDYDETRMTDEQHFKEAMVSHRMHFLYVKQTLNNQAI